MNTLLRLLPLALLACTDGDDTDTDGADTDTDTTGDTDTTPPTDPFVFATDTTGAYVRVDRMGMPAVATAVITDKDAYNAGDPDDDIAYTFAAEITANIDLLHVALDDDLTGLLLTPCITAACVGQAAPYVIPDVVAVDTAATAGFPNGRSLPDQVIDVTLALILLDLGTHEITTFADLPLNPAANDVAFPGTFPYLAPAHP